MKLFYLAFKNMVSKPLNLLMSLLLLLLSISLVTFAMQLSQQLEGKLSKNIAPFDMVVGAKGSPLQLVLSSVLHVDAPTGNIPLKEAKTLQKHPYVEIAIPVSYGDNYKGYRILGTEASYLEHYNAELQEGQLNSAAFEVVVGSDAARKLGLKIGDSFVSSHGLIDSDIEEHDEHPFTVKGILKSTGTVVDQLLITNLESIWDAHNHEDEAHDDEKHKDEEHDHEHGDDDHDHKEHQKEEEDHEHDEDREITSLLIKFKNPIAMVQLPRHINENTSMQAALPGFEINRLMGLLGSGVKTINGIAIAILLVSGLSIFISLLKTIRERKQELALLRTYGLSTGQLLGLALLEGLFLAFLGFVLGWLLGRLGIWGTSQYMQSSYGYSLQISGPQTFELFLLIYILALAIVASLLASISIFKLNVAKTLSDA